MSTRVRAGTPRAAGGGRARAAAPMALLLVAACGIPTVPRLPEPGAPAADTMAPGAPALTGMEIAPDCFRRHLREAIELNEARRATYSAWSGGATEAITDQLIRAERTALLAAWLVDRRSAGHRKAGVPIGCAEFAPMDLAPRLETTPPAPPPVAPEPGPDPDSLRAALIDAYGAGGFPAVRRTAEALLVRLADQPAYHCMMRHIAESVARVALLAPRHAEAAAAAGLDSTLGISELLLRLHIAALPDAAALDERALPLQAQGVPILCRDVPPLYPVDPAGTEPRSVPGGQPRSGVPGRAGL